MQSNIAVKEYQEFVTLLSKEDITCNFAFLIPFKFKKKDQYKVAIFFSVQVIENKQPTYVLTFPRRKDI